MPTNRRPDAERVLEPLPSHSHLIQHREQLRVGCQWGRNEKRARLQLNIGRVPFCLSGSLQQKQIIPFRYHLTYYLTFVMHDPAATNHFQLAVRDEAPHRCVIAVVPVVPPQAKEIYFFPLEFV